MSHFTLISSAGLFTPLYFTPLSLIHIQLSLGSFVFFITSSAPPQWKEKSRVSSFESDGALTGWNLCPIPRACSCTQLHNAYLPKHTSTQNWQEYTHPHPRMHTFINMLREHTCALTHTSTFSYTVCVYISRHIFMLYPVAETKNGMCWGIITGFVLK